MFLKLNILIFSVLIGHYTICSIISAVVGILISPFQCNNASHCFDSYIRSQKS
jgi:hypothetical protein